MSGSHHGVIARALLDQVAFLDQRITQMEDGAIEALARIPQPRGVDATGETGPRAGKTPDSPVLAAAWRLAEIPGIRLMLAIALIAETGLDMAQFPAADHLVSWIGLCRAASQSGTRQGKGKQKKGNSYARCLAGQAAIGASGTSSFPGQRHARVARRRGKAIAQVAAARSIMIIVWHLLPDPQARYRDPGAGWHERRTGKDKKIRDHIRQLEALGLSVTVTADPEATAAWHNTRPHHAMTP
jgi:transposase